MEYKEARLGEIGRAAEIDAARGKRTVSKTDQKDSSYYVNPNIDKREDPNSITGGKSWEGQHARPTFDHM